jgi:hypothetical protein
VQVAVDDALEDLVVAGELATPAVEVPPDNVVPVEPAALKPVVPGLDVTLDGFQYDIVADGGVGLIPLQAIIACLITHVAGRLQRGP